MSKEPERIGGGPVIPYNLNTSPEDMTPGEFQRYQARHCGRVALVYRDDSRTEVSEYHHPACKESRCPGCNKGGMWSYLMPDIEPGGTQLATAMARLQQGLISNVRAGRVGWTPDDHPALLLATKQAVLDALLDLSAGDKLTAEMDATAEFLARGFVATVLKSVRSYRSDRRNHG